jgi:hypothetical protein
LYFGVGYSNVKNLFQENHYNPQLNHYVGMVGTIRGHEVAVNQLRMMLIHSILLAMDGRVLKTRVATRSRLESR